MGAFVLVPLALAYAIVRYNVFSDVPWSDAPTFVANKGISLASVLLFAVSYLANRRMPANVEARRRRRRLARTSGLTAFWLMVLHVVISLGILDARHYPLLTSPATGITTVGEICIITGAVGVLVFAAPAVSSTSRITARLSQAAWRRAQQLGYLALAFTSAHVLAIGVQNFTAVDRWPGTLPPISLISFVACLVPIVAKVASVTRRRRATAGES